MKYEKENLGTMVDFLLPSLKLKQRGEGGKTLEDDLHHFLLHHFNGYTATAGNVFGYWKNANGKEFYGEHIEYKVSLKNKKSIGLLENFLIKMAAEMNELSVYLAAGNKSWLLYPKNR